MSITKLNNRSLTAVTALPSGVGGKVLQIKATANNSLSQAATSSTSLVDVSGVDLLLTPSSASSKIVLFTHFTFDSGSSNQGIVGSLSYTHSGISQTSIDSQYDSIGVNSVSSRINSGFATNYYLEPSTTNEITFRMRIKADGAYTVYFNRKSLRIIAIEYSA